MDLSGSTLPLILVGYVLGGIPFGVVVCKLMGAPDPRTVGSKNVGFTNVLRVAGKQAGILTLIGDMGKGWIMAYGATQWYQTEWPILLIAIAPFIGHLYSPFLKFKGGKGVATALGSVLGVAPMIGLVLLVAWVGAVALWRYSSGGALTAFGLFPIIALFVRPTGPFLLFSLTVTALIVVKHKDNIIRLLRGTEPKIGERR
ncbi:MAG: glycerol-3-phosphate 1-O-acyltransferase PlsY [Nitrospira sp.]|nr:glycerol-3-phosphate 1-O-acyltransferase PlsY [Nitrospira sp.]